MLPPRTTRKPSKYADSPVVSLCSPSPSYPLLHNRPGPRSVPVHGVCVVVHYPRLLVIECSVATLAIAPVRRLPRRLWTVLTGTTTSGKNVLISSRRTETVRRPGSVRCSCETDFPLTCVCSWTSGDQTDELAGRSLIAKPYFLSCQSDISAIYRASCYPRTRRGCAS